MNVVDQTKEKMAAAIEHLRNELKNIRTGRANPGILDGISVDIYGSSMRLKEIATISAPEPRLLLISPFEPKNASTIGKAIEKANLGINPIVDGNAIRLKIPPMDDSMRKEMVKTCHKRCEETKVSIRNIRQEGNKAAKKQKESGDIPEDLLKKIEKNIQELTDKYCKEAEEVTAKKEKEVSTI